LVINGMERALAWVLPSLCATARERGSTSIEYGLIALLVGIGFLARLNALGDGNRASWGATSNKITGAMKNAGP
jgi:Flp pilus assembly pilin Flp